MSSTSRPRTTVWTALRHQIQHTRTSLAERRALERELALYTSESDLNDLHAILDRYSDAETAHIRRILTRHAA
jgi:hypothetical protein